MRVVRTPATAKTTEASSSEARALSTATSPAAGSPPTTLAITAIKESRELAATSSSSLRTTVGTSDDLATALPFDRTSARKASGNRSTESS